MKKFFCLVCLLYFAIHTSFAQKKIELASPDKSVRFRFYLTKEAPVYSVSFKGKTLIEASKLGLTFAGSDSFSSNLKTGKPVFSKADEYYDLPVGKASRVRNHYRQVLIPLTEKNGRKINLVVRAFDDGVAFRYEFPQQKNWKNYTLTDENSTFHLAGDPKVLTLFRENYTTSHEGFYDHLPLSRIKADTLMDMPTLFEFPGKMYMAITEAALRNYAGMYLIKHNGVLKSDLSPLPGQKANKVKAVLPHKTPWRVMLIGDRPGVLIESNILTSLNEPTKIKDLSWLKPGKTTFHWWNGDVMPDTTFAPGNNFEFNKYYIDFCAQNGIAYHSVIGYGESAWYKNDGISYMPGPNTDILKTTSGIDMQKICDYAKSKGVDIRVWVHWQALYPKLEAAFSQFEKWSIKGMMVDFLDRDDQEMVNIQEEILARAAAHHLHIQFHGAYKPTGINRTYPNELTREGTLNYENNKWGKPMSPDHDLNMPFTRMLAGATDYHQGGFRAVPDKDFKVQYTRPLMAGTRCHMLAMYVVLESYLGMVCDYPQAYAGQPGFEFIRDVPVVWDETRVPAGEVGEFVTLARRKGKDWYIGTINNTRAKSIDVKLDFLTEGNYTAEMYSDAPDVAEHPNHLVKQTRTLKKGDVLNIKLAAGGGQVLHLKKD